MEDNKISKNIDFENGEDISYHQIKKEYRKKMIKFLPYLTAILIIIVIHFSLIYPFLLIPGEGATITGFSPYRFNITINWSVFSVGAFVIFYLLKIAFMRVTPSLSNSIRNDISNLGFIIQEKRKSWILFLILNSISVLILFLIEFGIISFNNAIINMAFKVILIIYLFVSILVPILWRFLYDRIKIVLKDKYHISIKPYYKVRKSYAEDLELIGIFLTSNKITNRFNKTKKKLYRQISGDRWLPREKKSVVSKYKLSPFLRFYEFSTPKNFKNQFLNIVLALQEWDTNVKN